MLYSCAVTHMAIVALKGLKCANVSVFYFSLISKCAMGLTPRLLVEFMTNMFTLSVGEGGFSRHNVSSGARGKVRVGRALQSLAPKQAQKLSHSVGVGVPTSDREAEKLLPQLTEM